MTTIDISDDYTSVYISVYTAGDLKMTINMKVDVNNTYLTRIDFYYKGDRTNITKIDEKWVLLLKNEYCNLVNNLGKSTDYRPKKDISKQINSIIKSMTNIRKIARSIFQTAHVLNVDTEDGYREIVFARTRIELDADILTILRPDFLKIGTVNHLLVLHSLNVNLANNLFRFRLYSLFSSIINLINIARIFVISIWYSKSLYALSDTYINAIHHINTHGIY